MITKDPVPLLAPQTCPFCQQPQDVIVNGHIHEGEKHLRVLEDKGYSFCNCKNIFFTSWENMRQGIYDEDYAQKYLTDGMRRAAASYANAYLNTIRMITGPGKFLEIGAVAPFLLTQAKKRGYDTIGLDIIKHDFGGHECIAADFEKWTPNFQAGVVWASHIFEHFQDPLGAARKCFDLLTPGGVLFVAMPDPYFVDWQNPYKWGHWHIQEHHILWDMDSFCKELEAIGFEVVMAERNIGVDFIGIGDYHLIFRKGLS